MYAVSTRTTRSDNSKKASSLATDSYLHKLAFDYTAQASIVSTVRNGKILLVNGAACKLLGYSRKSLLTKKKTVIFNTEEGSLKKMLKQRTSKGHSSALVTVIKKDGKLLSCMITSAIFRAEDGVEKSISTIADINKNILKRSHIDKKKEKIVAENIIVAQAKSDARLKEGLKHESKLKERQIIEARQDAKDTERSDIGKELHDNINQLLAASKMYIDMAQSGGLNSKMYLSRSSQYTREAIEEIRKLSKGLTSDIIKNLGLTEAIDKIARDTMEMSSLKISVLLQRFEENDFDDKFKLNVYRIIQEQLNNILKHASATSASITLKRLTRSLVLTISDDGVGFDTCKKQKGIGLANIKSRAITYKGTADFVCLTRKGCTLTVRFSIPATS